VKHAHAELAWQAEETPASLAIGTLDFNDMQMAFSESKCTLPTRMHI